MDRALLHEWWKPCLGCDKVGDQSQLLLKGKTLGYHSLPLDLPLRHLLHLHLLLVVCILLGITGTKEVGVVGAGTRIKVVVVGIKVVEVPTR